jgi:hypothetical protein
MLNNINIFIWTEVFNCGKIGAVSIKSFLKHHPSRVVHVYGKKADLDLIDNHHNLVKIYFPSGIREKIKSFIWRYFNIGSPLITEQFLDRGFKAGHLGTARLWSYLIKSRPEGKCIHFDSDVIFFEGIVNDIANQLDMVDLVGPVRNYEYNQNSIDDVRGLRDVSQTCCFGFNKNKIGNYSYKILTRMCQGSFNPRGHKIIDFFDPVMFDILGNGGSIGKLCHDEVGGCNSEGSRENKFSKINNFKTPFKIDFGSKMMHFSAVGSGANIYHNKTVNIPESYRAYALDRYALFCKIFYLEDLGIDLSMYSDLISELNNIDLQEWRYTGSLG